MPPAGNHGRKTEKTIIKALLTRMSLNHGSEMVLGAIRAYPAGVK
jgi:hypothetical protein